MEVAGRRSGGGECRTACSDLAVSLLHQGKDAEAEPMLRRLHEVAMRVHGAEHKNTLTVASNLASALTNQGKYADAERIQREVLGALKRVPGAEHPDTLLSANNLAWSMVAHKPRQVRQR